MDSVHQGDFDGIKGVYLINLIDAVTQYVIVCSVERIAEIFLIPVLEHALGTFPFVIRRFHSDNGSEYINHRVAAMLDKLHIQFTKCRARRTNDHALVELHQGQLQSVGSGRGRRTQDTLRRAVPNGWMHRSGCAGWLHAPDEEDSRFPARELHLRPRH